ncbi:hypothetical protein ACQ4PT_040365 [Festuca glaucescens]
MLLPLRRLHGLLRRSLSTAASRPSWAMIYRISTADESARGASLSLAPPPLASHLSIPRHAFGLEPFPDNTERDPVNFFSSGAPDPKQGASSPRPPSTDRNFINVFGSGVLAASGDGLLLFGTYRNRANAWRMFEHQPPTPVPFEVLDQVYARSFYDPMRVARFVCNPVTGEMVRLPDFDGTENAFSAATGLLTQADGGGRGPPKRYAAAQLSVVDGGQRFLLRRLSSETGEWDELVLPSPLPPGRRMHVNHEVLDYGDRLWWVDVSWGAVCVDPFSDRPELCPVELPGDIILPDQQGEEEMWQLVKHRRMGVSDGRLRFVEVCQQDPFRINSFTLDDQSGRWILEHQVSWRTIFFAAKTTPSIAAIGPLSVDSLYLTVPMDKGFCISADLRRKSLIESMELGSGIHPSKCESSFLLPCVLPSFLGSSPIPGKNDVRKRKTLADVLVRSDRHLKA